MNKRIFTSISIVLAVGIVVTGVLYAQETGKLKDVKDEIASLEGNVSTLQTELAASEAEVTRLDGELTAAESEVTRLDGELTAAEAKVSPLEADLAGAEAEVSALRAEFNALVSALEADLAGAEAEVSALRAEFNALVSSLEAEASTLESNLATANTRVSTLETELASAEAEVSNLEGALASAEAEIAALEAALATPTPTPTPLALPPPTFSVEEGVFGTYQIVTIQVDIQDVQIFYTLTGSEPTTASAAYTGPIEVRTSRTIKAIAVKEGWNNSPVASATYIIDYGDLPIGEIGGLQYASWDFGIERFKDFYIDITIHSEPDNHDGLYFQMYQGYINGVGFYFGLQTDVYRPGVGSTGKGLIFSRWGTRDTSNVRIVEGGWSQSAGYEGDFVGIRKNYDWTTHKYQFRLNLIESDSVGDWYGVWIYDYDIGFEDYLGSIRFPATEEPNNAGIRNNGITWTELYYKAEIPTPIPDWHVSIDGIFATLDRIAPQHAYIWYSTDILTNTDIYWDSGNNEIHFLMGPRVTREQQPGQVY